MRTFFANVAVLLVTVILMGVIGEVVLRSLEGETDDTPIRTATTDPFVPRLIPGAVAKRSGVEIRVNELGLRDDSVTVPKPAGTFRILSLGDSYTFGTGVEQDETISAALERHLARLTGSDAVESINLGIDGANTYDSFARLERIGLPLEPDLVLFFFLFNDVFKMERGREWLAGRSYDPEGARRAHRRAKRESYLVRYFAPRVAGLIRGVMGKKAGKLANWDAQFEDDVPAWRETKQTILDARNAAAARGVRFVIALLPAFADFNDETYPLPRYRAAVRAFGEEAEIPVVDLHEPFWGGSGRPYWINPLDPHPNGEACDTMAEHVAEALVAAGLVPVAATP